MIAYLLKFIAIAVIPLIKYTFEKVHFFLDGLHIGNSKITHIGFSGRF